MSTKGSAAKLREIVRRKIENFIAPRNMGDSSIVADEVVSEALPLLAPDPEPRFRPSKEEPDAVSDGMWLYLRFTSRATPQMRATVLAALNALDEKENGRG